MQTKIVAALIDSDAETAAELAPILIEARLDVAVIGPHGIQVAELVKEQRPGIVFVSVEAPVIRAQKTIEFIAAVLPDTTIVAYAWNDDMARARRALQAGANNFLVAPFSGDEIRQVLRPLAARPEPEHEAAELPSGLVVTVIGQKGGIGKTTIATNLAVALQRETSASTLIIDLDTLFGDVAVMLDVEPAEAGSATARADQPLDRNWFDNACTRHPSGVYVLPAPAPSAQSLAATPEGVARLVEAASHLFDYVILDTPGTFNEVIGASIGCADKVVAVTSPELASLKNTCLLLEHLEYAKFPSENVLVVMNNTTAAITPSRAEVTRALGREISWEVPHDRSVRMANQAGRQVVADAPRSPSGQSLQRLAAVLAGKDAAVARQAVEAMMPVRLHGWRGRSHVTRILRVLPITFRF